MVKMSKAEAVAIGDAVQILHSALEHVAKKHGAEIAHKALAVELQALAARGKAAREQAGA